MAKREDISGNKYGRVTVIEYAGTSEDKRALWKCSCDCGRTFVTRGKDLRQGKVNSCGCARKERCRDRMRKINTTHGHRDSRLYVVWRDMKSRVLNQKNKNYLIYGGRGIKICDEWMDFQRFYDWAMSSGYDQYAPFGECTIDRIDVNGNYEPSNCRWVDMKTQANNRRKKLIQGGNEE